MKRITTAALSAVIAFTLIGCAPADDTAPPPAATSTEQPTEEPADTAPLNPTDALAVGDCYITSTPDAGNNVTYEVIACERADRQVLGLLQFTEEERAAISDDTLNAEMETLYQAWWAGHGEDPSYLNGYGRTTEVIQNDDYSIKGLVELIYAEL